jgi:hypothetical protein
MHKIAMVIATILTLIVCFVAAPIDRAYGAEVLSAYELGPAIKEVSATITPSLPDLAEFTETVKNERSHLAVGVYVADVLALPILQQPANQAAYVSNQEGVVTQFQMASSFGTVGLLAHNTLAGAVFSHLEPGQIVTLVYGDGKTKNYRIEEISSYQALTPNSPYSRFQDLHSSGNSISAADLFTQIYMPGDRLVFQTCIENNNNLSWGRLFITAYPFEHIPVDYISYKYAYYERE